MKNHPLIDAIEQQVTWIVDHGGDEKGYVARYGSKFAPFHYGDGGEAIYAADHAYFQQLMVEATKKGLFVRKDVS